MIRICLLLVFTVFAWVASCASVSAQTFCANCGRQMTVQRTVHSTRSAPLAPISHHSQRPNVLAAYGNPRAVAIAMKSAQYRAATGRSGHSRYDSGNLGVGYKSGVGYQSRRTPNVRTCYYNLKNHPRSGYVAVAGRNGTYATLIHLTR